MRHVDRVLTFDGCLHVNEEYADRHLRKLYDQTIDSLLRVIGGNTSQDQLCELIDLINANPQSFPAISKITKDMIVEKD